MLAQYTAMTPIAHGHSYLEQERCLPLTVLKSPHFADCLYTDPYQNTVFPHHDRHGICSFEIHNFRLCAWGYLEEAHERWREEWQRQAALQRPPAQQRRVPSQRQAVPSLVRPPAARPAAPREPAPARPDLAQPLAAFQAALPGSRGAAYLQQRGMPLALAQQLGVGYAASGRGPHPARDWRGGRVVVPHTTLEGRLVNLYGRAVRWTVPAELSRVRWIC